MTNRTDDPDQELLALIEETESAPPDIAAVRQKAIDLRDLHLFKADLEAQLEVVNERIKNVQQRDLVDMFNEAGISSITVDPDGNHPGFVAERNTVIGAKIPDETRKEALAWFEDNGHGDLVRATVSVIFGMQEHEKRIALLKLLAQAGYEYRTDENIHHMTLKAFVKNEIRRNHILPRDLLGVYVFDHVTIKQEE